MYPTGEYHTVRDFTTLAFKEAGIKLKWTGKGLEEKSIDVDTDKVFVEVDPKYFRPAEDDQLLGDPTKAKTVLGWNPRKKGLNKSEIFQSVRKFGFIHMFSGLTYHS